MSEPTGISKKIVTTSTTLENRFRDIGRAYIIDKRIASSCRFRSVSEI